MGAIAPTAKKLWGDAPSRPHRNFVVLPLYTAKRYGKNYYLECVIIYYETEKGALIFA